MGHTMHAPWPTIAQIDFEDLLINSSQMDIQSHWIRCRTVMPVTWLLMAKWFSIATLPISILVEMDYSIRFVTMRLKGSIIFWSKRVKGDSKNREYCPLISKTKIVFLWSNEHMSCIRSANKSMLSCWVIMTNRISSSFIIFRPKDDNPRYQAVQDAYWTELYFLLLKNIYLFFIIKLCFFILILIYFYL